MTHSSQPLLSPLAYWDYHAYRLASLLSDAFELGTLESFKVKMHSSPPPEERLREGLSSELP
ncbi:MAG: hypothetical protein NW237_11445 [Cyanobacteriota bacterium]|nr:hypothetical protein [Cyanobacteriota bacterium]